jgi:hypothetical protein
MTYIKNYSENRGLAEALLQRKLIAPTGHVRRNGSAEFKQYYILPKLGERFGITLPEGCVTPPGEADPAGVDQRIAIASTPTDEAAMEESPTSFAGLAAQQNAAMLEKARQEKAEQEGSEPDPDAA